MCRYASLDQPRPRRCVELRSPCEECAREEQAKMDELGEEHFAAKEREHVKIRINDSLVAESQ
jgi:hypothetical protein